MHALTGCNSVSYPFAKRKSTAIGVLLKPECSKLDDIFGKCESSQVEILDSWRHFFSLLYGAKSNTTMNDLRYSMFTKMKDTPKLNMLPPTDENLVHHLKRAHLQCMIWKAADQDNPPKVDQQQFGWEIKDDLLRPSIDGCPPAPPSIMKVIACKCKSKAPCA